MKEAVTVMSESAKSIASSKIPSKSDKCTTLFAIRERIDPDAADALLASEGMSALCSNNAPMWTSICDSIRLSKAIGGYTPTNE